MTAASSAWDRAVVARVAAARARVDGVRARIGPRRLRLIDLGLRGGWVAALILFALFRPVPAGDAHALWAVDLAAPYSHPIASPDSFNYPPPAALVFGALGHIPFPIFQAGWTILLGLLLLWMAGPWAAPLMVLPVVNSELYIGNIHLILAAAVVASFRWPALWAIPLLTKPTCGLGLLWYAARGEWRRLGTTIAATGVLVVLSVVIAPGLWGQWISYALGTGFSPNVGTAAYIPIPLLIRLPVAALVVLWGARTDRAWTLPIGTMLALPVLWAVGLSMVVGSVALLRDPTLRMQRVRAGTVGARTLGPA